ADGHDAGVRVEVLDLAQQKVNVRRVAEDAAHRRSDLARFQARGRDLVQQRRKQVEVVPVHQQHVDGLARQLLRSVEAAKADADDQDAGTMSVRHGSRTPFGSSVRWIVNFGTNQRHEKSRVRRYPNKLYNNLIYCGKSHKWTRRTPARSGQGREARVVLPPLRDYTSRQARCCVSLAVPVV